MATVLDVVNDCLATLGEAPLNSLQESHEFRGSAQRTLTRVSREIQAKGWWFNTEEATLVPNQDGHIYLPGDCAEWRDGSRSRKTLLRSKAKPWIVQRGQRLYDTNAQSFVLTETEVVGEFIRVLPFEDTPSTINALIAANTVLRFQSNFDADNSRRQEIKETSLRLLAEANAENTRQLAVNMLNNNARLQRIKSAVRTVRGY